MNSLLIDYLYTVEDYQTYVISINSDKFSGETNFCFSKKSIDDYLHKIKIINSELKGYCEFEDYDTDSKICLECKQNGHVNVSGQIGGSHEDNYLIFKFGSDQTIFQYIINAFDI